MQWTGDDNAYDDDDDDYYNEDGGDYNDCDQVIVSYSVGYNDDDDDEYDCES